MHLGIWLSEEAFFLPGQQSRLNGDGLSDVHYAATRDSFLETDAPIMDFSFCLELALTLVMLALIINILVHPDFLIDYILF